MDISQLRENIALTGDYQMIHDFLGDGMDTFRDYYPYSLRPRAQNISEIRRMLNSKKVPSSISLTYYGITFTVTPDRMVDAVETLVTMGLIHDTTKALDSVPPELEGDYPMWSILIPSDYLMELFIAYQRDLIVNFEHHVGFSPAYLLYLFAMEGSYKGYGERLFPLLNRPEPLNPDFLYFPFAAGNSLVKYSPVRSFIESLDRVILMHVIDHSLILHGDDYILKESFSSTVTKDIILMLNLFLDILFIAIHSNYWARSKDARGYLSLIRERFREVQQDMLSFATPDFGFVPDAVFAYVNAPLVYFIYSGLYTGFVPELMREAGMAVLENFVGHQLRWYRSVYPVSRALHERFSARLPYSLRIIDTKATDDISYGIEYYVRALEALGFSVSGRDVDILKSFGDSAMQFHASAERFQSEVIEMAEGLPTTGHPDHAQRFVSMYYWDQFRFATVHGYYTQALEPGGEGKSVYDHIMSRILPFVTDEAEMPSRHLKDRHFLFSGRLLFNNYYLDPSMELDFSKGFQGTPAFAAYEKVFGEGVQDRQLLSLLNSFYLLSYPLVIPVSTSEYSLHIFEKKEQKDLLVDYLRYYYDPYSMDKGEGRAPPFIYVFDYPDFLLYSIRVRLRVLNTLAHDSDEEGAATNFGLSQKDRELVYHDYPLVEEIFSRGGTLDDFLSQSRMFIRESLLPLYFRYSFLLASAFFDLNINPYTRDDPYPARTPEFFQPGEYLFDGSPENTRAMEFYSSLPFLSGPSLDPVKLFRAEKSVAKEVHSPGNSFLQEFLPENSWRGLV